MIGLRRWGNKSEVRSAIGWIGLAWLSPYVGGAIYLAFGVNRVARRASKIQRPLRLTDYGRPDPANSISLDQDNIRTLAAVGDRTTVLLDSGVRSGLDIARALALGADFVLLGRAFMFGVAALGARGGDHVAEILLDDLRNNMAQLGCKTPAELVERLDPARPARMRNAVTAR